MDCRLLAVAIVDGASTRKDASLADVSSVLDAGLDAPSDALVCPARGTGLVGAACGADSACDTSIGANDGVCLRGDVGGVLWPAAGYCMTKIDSCTDDASCGSGNMCVTVGDGYTACVPSCAGAPCNCPDGQICAGSLTGNAFASAKQACVPGRAGARDGDACTDVGACAVDSWCVRDVEHPGGQCRRVGCTVANDGTCASGGDGHCVTSSTLVKRPTARAARFAMTRSSERTTVSIGARRRGRWTRVEADTRAAMSIRVAT